MPIMGVILSLADHITKLRNFTKSDIRECLAFPFLFQLMFEQILCNLKRNKSHDLGAVHLEEIIKTNHVQLNSRI